LQTRQTKFCDILFHYSRGFCDFISFLFILPITGACRRIWVIGSSIVRRAAHAALVSPQGPDLGFPPGTIRWWGVGGMRWIDFPTSIITLLESERPPHIVVVHLGGNDLAQLQLGQLIQMFRLGFQWLRRHCPNSRIAFSAILPRRAYRGAVNNQAIDNCRRSCNRYIRRIMREIDGVFIPHPQISFQSAPLFHDDGVHLSPRGDAVFLNTLSDALRSLA
jgi:hypothetical protein